MTAVLNAPEQRVVLRGLSWETYCRIVTERGDNSGPRLTYDCGTLEIMMPSLKHETLKETIRGLFELIADEMALDFAAAGSTTFRREDLNKGFEPDSCFYIQRAAHIRGKDEIDLNIDPPPDLVIEIDVAKSSLHKLGIYAAVGVREIWRYADDVLQIFELEGKDYTRKTASSVLGAVTSLELTELIQSNERLTRSVWVHQVREFAQKKKI
jgi:Uma2 family endonuclease